MQRNAVLLVVCDSAEGLGEVLQELQVVFIQKRIVTLLFDGIVVDQLEVRDFVEKSQKLGNESRN